MFHLSRVFDELGVRKRVENLNTKIKQLSSLLDQQMKIECHEIDFLHLGRNDTTFGLTFI